MRVVHVDEAADLVAAFDQLDAEVTEPGSPLYDRYMEGLEKQRAEAELDAATGEGRR